VGSGRSAGRSGQAYGITLAQGRSVTDIDPTQVGIAGLAAVAVVQANYVAVGATPARLDGHAVARDKNRAAAVDSDIDAAVKAWRGASQARVDEANVKYVIVHLHRLLDPDRPVEFHQRSGEN